MAKKRSTKKAVKEECCDIKTHHCCKVFLIKIASMAFLLFLMTVWTGLGRALLSVHWGVYLAIVIVLIIIHLASGCCCKKK
jgi:hypothetical protein